MNNDINELTALNKAYTDSTQNSDAKRFDEILAPEFYCTWPDKSFQDRAAFLAHISKPVTIKGLTPVNVQIRIFGDDFAVIHAQTQYTMADGEEGLGRYTDCWAKIDGKWLAVAAHVDR
jgi:hypothetical protein